MATSNTQCRSGIHCHGGDQANYINFWMGTPVQQALNEAVARNIPIGGTSAGLAVQGEYVYSAQGERLLRARPDLTRGLCPIPSIRASPSYIKFLDNPLLKGSDYRYALFCA